MHKAQSLEYSGRDREQDIKIEEHIYIDLFYCHLKELKLSLAKRIYTKPERWPEWGYFDITKTFSYYLNFDWFFFCVPLTKQFV